MLDPFAGSGTTVDVAIEQGRVGEGIEINRDFESVMRDRLGQRADAVQFVGEGEQGREDDDDEASSGPQRASTRSSADAGRTPDGWRSSRDRHRYG